MAMALGSAIRRSPDRSIGRTYSEQRLPLIQIKAKDPKRHLVCRMDAKTLREQAAQYRREATAVTDEAVRDSLLLLAETYEKEADNVSVPITSGFFQPDLS